LSCKKNHTFFFVVDSFFDSFLALRSLLLLLLLLLRVCVLESFAVPLRAEDAAS